VAVDASQAEGSWAKSLRIQEPCRRRTADHRVNGLLCVYDLACSWNLALVQSVRTRDCEIGLHRQL